MLLDSLVAVWDELKMPAGERADTLLDLLRSPDLSDEEEDRILMAHFDSRREGGTKGNELLLLLNLIVFVPESTETFNFH